MSGSVSLIDGHIDEVTTDKTCKDCIHYDVCLSRISFGMGYDEVTGKAIEDIDTRCHDFKDKSRFIELPCKVGDRVHTKYGNSFKVVSIDILNNTKVFRCGNDGTDDYMAFHEFEIGDYVFLTKEEAEVKLKELQNEKNNF